MPYDRPAQLSPFAKSRRASLDHSVKASDFADISPEALRVLAARSVSEPHFAWKISLFLPPLGAFERNFRTKKTLFSEALSQGQLALAHALALRLARRVPAEKHEDWRSSYRIHDGFEEHMSTLIKGSGSDLSIWRARSWMTRILSGEKQSSTTARTAAHALAWGRPELALLMCEELERSTPADLARATLMDNDVPDDVFFGKLDPADLRGSWIKNHSYASGDKTINGDTLSRCALLDLLKLWARLASQAASDHPKRTEMIALAKRLSVARQTLWAHGASSSPGDYAKLFFDAPFKSGDVRVVALAELNETAKITERMGPAWARAAASAEALCGGSIAWDTFVEAHAGLAGVSPDPFTIVNGPTCPALWSLAGDGSLARLGLERGFSPVQADRVVVEYGRSSGAVHKPFEALSPVSGAAQLDHGWSRSFCVPGIWIHSKPSSKANLAKTGAETTSKLAKTPKAKAPKTGNKWAASGILKIKFNGSESREVYRSSLATLALLAGNRPVALALMRAGCAAPDAGQAASELSGSGDVASRLLSICDAFVLAELFPPTPAAEPDAPAPRPARRSMKV